MIRSNEGGENDQNTVTQITLRIGEKEAFDSVIEVRVYVALLQAFGFTTSVWGFPCCRFSCRKDAPGHLL